MKQKDIHPQQSSTYQTGATTPPKDGSNMIAILLVLVIFLAGLVSILSMLNIRLFSALYHNQEVPLMLELSHEPQEQEEDAAPLAAEGNKSIGIVCDPITPVYQKHFQLPEGLLITYVEETSTAHHQGVQEGDVLLTLDGVAMTQEADLLQFLEQHEINDRVTGVFYRLDTSEHLTVPLTIETIQP